MSGFDLDRRKLLEGMGALGASALLQAALPIKLARAAQLISGFVYIGPRLDWGWNESHAVAALALEGVPHAGVVQADYLPESTNYGSGKDDPQTRAYSEAMERLITDGGARLVISTSFDDDPFLLAMAKKPPRCHVPPSLQLREQRQPAECRQLERAHQPGPLLTAWPPVFARALTSSASSPACRSAPCFSM